MLGENPHHGALHGSAVVEQSGRNSLNGVAMLEKQRLSRSAWRTSHAGQFIHRGIADLAFDRFAVVQHGESERQPFVVISYNATARQRHPQAPLSIVPKRAFARWFVEKVAPRAETYFVSAGSRCTGSIHNTVSGFSTGSMSRLIATAWPSLRTSTHSSTSSRLALISWCGTYGGTKMKSPGPASAVNCRCSPQRIRALPFTT